MEPGQIVLLSLLAFLVLLVAFIFAYQARGSKRVKDTQRLLTDKALLQLLDEHPGGLLSVHEVAERTPLSVGEARSRLYYLATQSVLRMGAGGNRHYYELYAPYEEPSFELSLSEDPFLTLEDLQQIFKAYDHRVSPGDLIIATGLPWKVLAREMTYFQKKGVIQKVRIARPGDSLMQYVLKEPYLSQPMEAEAEAINLELKEILRNDNLLV
ncbi:MAG: hypothetical protein AAGA31_16605 [Bacteroidota bacterium]